jgi:hypothetical protein
VCLLCQKCTLFCLVLKTFLKFSLYYVLNENSNMMTSKLRGLCCTQSCDPLCSLEITCGMSNMVISKLQGVCRTQSYDPLRGLVSHPVFKAKTRCSSYVCPGSGCHTYGQNVSTEYQCLYHTVSYYKNYYKSRKD